MDPPDARAMRTADHDEVHNGLSRLDALDREALVLRYGIGGAEPPKTIPEVARRLGCTTAAASQRLTSAKRRLAAAMVG